MKKKKYLYFVLVLVIGIFLYFSPTLAKYVSETFWDYYLKSKEFYFTSDHLSTTVAKNANNLWDGGSIHFNVKNSINNSVVSKDNIEYTLDCTIVGDAAEYTECLVNGTEESTLNDVILSTQVCINRTTDGADVTAYEESDCLNGGYSWEYQPVVNDIFFDISLTDESYTLTDVMVNITVTSTLPYSKTLSGLFTLHKTSMVEDTVTMSYENHSNYDSLIVSNSYLDNKCVEVSWNSDNLVIDEDYSSFSYYETDTNGYINKVKFNIDDKKSLSYKFYKKNFDVMYDISEFQLEESSGC